MKKSFLACSILLAAAGCSANEGGLAAASSEAITQQQQASLGGDTFLSKDAYATTNNHGQAIQAKLRMKFAKADGLTDDAGEILDYEVTVEWVDVATGEVSYVDSTFFARDNTKTPSKYDFFDCDSSQNCQTHWSTDLTVDASGTAKLTNTHLTSIFYGVDAPAVIDFVLVK